MILSLPKNTFFYLLFPVCFILMHQYSKKALDGFSELRIHSSIQKQIIPLPESLHTLYDQKFHYLDKGKQFYVFVSNDHKYVIKFIRFDQLKPRFLIRLLRWLPHRYIQAKQKRASFLHQRLFNSIAYAFSYLSEDTGLIHYQTHPLDKPLICFDKLNIMHKIKNAPFIVQHYSPKVESVIDQLNEEGMRFLIDELITLQKRRFDLGIEDTDAKMTTNFGFKDFKLTQIDIGQFRKVNKPFTKRGK